MRLIHNISRLLLLVTAITACDTQHASDSSPASDVEFIDAMVPHHRMAIHMADMELARGESAEIKDMAEAMKRPDGRDRQDGVDPDATRRLGRGPRSSGRARGG